MEIVPSDELSSRARLAVSEALSSYAARRQRFYEEDITLKRISSKKGGEVRR